MIKQNSVWLITGCSKGLGRALALEVLAAGYRVVLTARNPADLDDIVAAHGENALALQLDVTVPAQVTAAVSAAEKKFGGIDVLVNNAGYGYISAIEEGVEAEVRALFETNLFAPVSLIKAVLPAMRARQHGQIINITSIGGWLTYPGVGYYHMVKFALEAMSETLAKEVAPLGINVTAVAPGTFRTDFRGPDSMKYSAVSIDDYNDTAGKSRTGTRAGHGKQTGDPVLAARAIITAVESDNPPLHLILGSDALDQLRSKLDQVREETNTWEQITRGTDIQDSDT